MAIKLKRTVSELIIYDANDSSCTSEAKGTEKAHSQYGPWTVAAEGIHGVGGMSKALMGYVNITQISFCTHGYPGGVFLKGGSLSAGNLKSVHLSPSLFRGPGRILFMGCETARSQKGKDFLIAAGRHFFARKGGIVGGATIKVIGLTSGARLPLIGRRTGGIGAGKLVLYRLDANGKVIGDKTIKPFGL